MRAAVEQDTRAPPRPPPTPGRRGADWAPACQQETPGAPPPPASHPLRRLRIAARGLLLQRGTALGCAAIRAGAFRRAPGFNGMGAGRGGSRGSIGGRGEGSGALPERGCAVWAALGHVAIVGPRRAGLPAWAPHVGGARGSHAANPRADGGPAAVGLTARAALAPMRRPLAAPRAAGAREGNAPPPRGAAPGPRPRPGGRAGAVAAPPSAEPAGGRPKAAAPPSQVVVGAARRQV
jgi:hypothetical protein